jgi:hypothetical protein
MVSKVMEREERKILGCRFMQNECIPVSAAVRHAKCKFDGESCSLVTEEPPKVKVRRLEEVSVEPPKVKVRRLKHRDETNMKKILDDFFISGPISSYFFEHNGVKYFLYGDQHQSKENNCDELSNVEEYKDLKLPCVTTTRGRDENDVNCYDMVAHLDRIFTNAERTEKRVDFYLEVPFQDVDFDLVENIFSEQEEKKLKQDYIGSILYYFNKCFKKDKKDCKFSNVHFHYADIRQTPLKGLVLPEYKLFNTVIETCLPILRDLKRLQMLLSEDVGVLSAVDDVWGGKLGRTLQSIQLEDINAHVRAFFDRNTTASGETRPSVFEAIVDAIVQSTNFERDLRDIQERYIKDVLYKVKSILSHYPLLSTEDGKNYTELSGRIAKGITKKWDQMLSAISTGKHRVAKSLLKLDKVDKNLSDQIRNYIEKEKAQMINGIKMNFVYRWDKFYSRMIEILHARSQKGKLFKAPTQSMIADIKGLRQFVSGMTNFLGVLVMDAYLLARMLYQNSIRKTDTVVIFAGAAHIENYIRFFQSLENPPETIWEDYPDRNKAIIHGLRSTDDLDVVESPYRCVRTPTTLL